MEMSTLFTSITLILLVMISLARFFRKLIMSTPPSHEPLSHEKDHNEAPWESPSIEDVLEVKNILMQKPVSLPIELVDMIIDHAEYWPHTTVNIDRRRRPLVAIGGRASTENVFVARSLPIGILPQQLDRLTHIGITDEFVTMAPKPTKHTELSDSTKSATEKLKKIWASSTSIRGQNPCRKIVFTILSHDQGWGGRRMDHGTYTGSFTWFDVGLERIEAYETPANDTAQPQRVSVATAGSINIEKPSQDNICSLRTIIPTVGENGEFTHPFLPQDNHIVRNRVAQRTAEERVVTWSYTDDIPPKSPAAWELDEQGRGKASGNGEFVRNLKVGDVITVWARARFPAWVNNLEYCKIDVYWAV